MSVELTRVERAMLINQYEILKRLEPSEASWYEEKIDILRSGYELLYGDALFMGDDSTLSYDEGRYVMDVLDMYGFLQSSAEKAGLQDTRLKFHGFDGNNEDLYQGLAQHFRRAGRWEYVEVWHGDLNSHFPTRRKYEAMLAVYKPLFKRAIDQHTMPVLTTDEVLMVLDAGGQRPQE